MSLPEMKSTYEEADDDNAIKAVIRICHQGDLFYQKVAMMVKCYSLKKVCFEMAKHYQYLASRFRTSTATLNHQQQHVPSLQSHVYDIDLNKISSLSTEELIVMLSKLESGNLDSLKKSIRQINGKEMKNVLSDIAAHVQTTLDKLNALAESALKNHYTKE